jgi:hypothetical protein
MGRAVLQVGKNLLEAVMFFSFSMRVILRAVCVYELVKETAHSK